MSVARVVARSLVAGGVDAVFGVIGSGNFLLANELRDAGAPFHAARHECGAMMMADGYGRVSDRIAVCTTHQGPGFTNALTGLVEAAKARTPALLLTADTDFGELVFRQGRVHAGVMLLRLAGVPAATKADMIAEALRDHAAELIGAFSVVSPGLIRIRQRP